jgi:diadenosine tetraphosphate (Ap4A) HIT family hydrolase
MAASPTCIFCDIVAGRAAASVVYRDPLVTAFMDIQPVNPGHLLVIPNDHAVDLSDLPSATGGRLFEVAQQLAGALRRTRLKCEGINFFLADGEAAGQEVFHVHLHVLPRFAGDGFGLHYGPDYTKLPPRSALDEVAATVRQVLES